MPGRCTCVKLCWKPAALSHYMKGCQLKLWHPSLLCMGRDASHMIMHSCFWCFDEASQFSQKGQVRFIMPNCSGCVVLYQPAVRCMGAGPKNTHANDINPPLLSFCQDRERNIKTFEQCVTKGGDSTRVMVGRWSKPGGGKAGAHKTNSRLTHK